MSITSTKPYLLRAIHEWAEDNQFTPQVLVNADAVGVEVPRTHVVDGQIVLNISSASVKMHIMDNECLSFSARFSGKETLIYLPMVSILAIFARENSQGIFFEDNDSPPPPKATKPKPELKSKPKPTELNPSPSPQKNKKGSHLKVIK